VTWYLGAGGCFWSHSDGIGRERKPPSGKIGLATPPFRLSNPLRLKMIFTFVTPQARTTHGLLKCPDDQRRQLYTSQQEKIFEIPAKGSFLMNWLPANV